jgi:hypothetical protein
MPSRTSGAPGHRARVRFSFASMPLVLAQVAVRERLGELVQEVALLAGEPARDDDVDVHVQVARPGALPGGHAAGRAG